MPTTSLYEALKEVRLARARKIDKPAFAVFDNKTLDAIVAARPTTQAQLLSVKGIGPQKVAEMGESILRLCNNRALTAPVLSARKEAEKIDGGDLDHEQQQLRDALKEVRLARARKIDKPAFTVFDNKTLDAIVAARPTTQEQLLSVKGIGPQKVAEMGESILKLCRALTGVQSRRCTVEQGAQTPKRPYCPERTVKESQLATAHSSTCLKRQKLVQGPPSPHSAPQVTAPVPSARKEAENIQGGDLNHEQQQATSLAFRRQSLFLTGPAGVGKSFLLRYIIQSFQKVARHADEVVVTAPTGIAASHISGQTIHSFAGIGLGKCGIDKLLSKVMQNAAACARWRATEVLVIDEVSMLDSQLFEALEQIARRVRGVSAPFGGIQLVLCGDFFQLPPVSLSRGIGFAFESAAWQRCAVSTVLLHTQVRQSGDAAFAGMLNEVRLGLCSAATTAALMACHVRTKALPSDGIVPTKLYCKNAAVDEENESFLAELPGPARSFLAVDRHYGGHPTEEVRMRLLGMVEKKAVACLRLKVGAQVMLSRNWPDAKLVNGSRGIVVGFAEEQEGPGSAVVLVPRVRFDSGSTVSVHRTSFFQGGPGGALIRDQVPLKLGWALTVHKSQGMTLSRVAVQLDDAFDFGQTYVALSRARSLAGLWIQGGAVTQAAVKAHPAVIAFYRQTP